MLTHSTIADALATGREVWLLVDSARADLPRLYIGTEADVRARCLAWIDEPWPPTWTLRRVTARAA